MTDFRTERLRLRLLDARDAELYRALYTSPRVMARIGAPLDDARAARAFAAAVDANTRDRPGHRVFAVLEASTGAPLGIGALRRDGERAEIGLMLLPAAWDGRRSHEVLDALVAAGFGTAGIEALDAVCREGANVRPARRLLAPYGFREVPAAQAGTVQWSLCRRDWMDRGAATVGRVTRSG